MNFFATRRVRVRPEFAALYPEVTPGVWLAASKVTRLVRRGGPREPCTRHGCARGRVLCEQHFEFRGGHRCRQQLTGVPMQRLTAALG